MRGPATALASARLCVLAGIAALCGGAHAECVSAGQVEGAFARVLLAAPVAEPPRVDGTLDDPVWSEATCILLDRQVFPVEGAAASEVTEVRILRSTDAIFIGVSAFDRDPAAIVATQMARDADIFNDDHISIVFDPYGTRRDGFLFEVNAIGARRDALIHDGAEIRFEWDGLWIAQSRRDEFGWTAELEIPLTVLSFRRGLEEWGFNVERRIARRNELVRWRDWNRDKGISSLQDAGVLAGTDGIEATQALRVKATAVLRDTNGEAGRQTRLEPSLDLFWRPTPAFSAALTFNTDFAEADVDNRIVNLSRFPLFFPEKRTFFLEDAGIFNFGGSLSESGAWSPVPFFSRRIGLDAQGARLDLDAGARITGRAGPVSFGFLGTRVGSSDTAPATSLSVARALAQVASHSEVGVIATNGDPLRDARNTLLGTDYHFRDANLGGSGKALDVWTWYQETRAGDPDRIGRAYGMRLNYPNTGLTGNATLYQVDSKFDPALGFVEQTGVRRAYGETGYLMRPAGFNAVTPEIDWQWRSRIDGGLEYRSINPEVYVENLYGDYVFPEVFFEHERLFEPFEILPGIVVPAGSYDYRRYYLGTGTSHDRVVGADFVFVTGTYLTGTRRDLDLSTTWRHSSRFNLELSWVQNDVDLPEGRFIVRTRGVAMNLNLSTRLTSRLVVQHDNVSDDLGLSWRLRWTVGRDNDVFVVLNRNWSTREDLQTISRESVVKVAWNLLF